MSRKECTWFTIAFCCSLAASIPEAIVSVWDLENTGCVCLVSVHASACETVLEVRLDQARTQGARCQGSESTRSNVFPSVSFLCPVSEGYPPPQRVSNALGPAPLTLCHMIPPIYQRNQKCICGHHMKARERGGRGSGMVKGLHLRLGGAGFHFEN